nr:uncharacterized protein LOC110799944 [Spinacia oleracea]
MKAITEMPPSKYENQIWGFLGKLQYISRFIFKLTMTYEPIFIKLKKEDKAEWDEHCQKAFDKIKEYLSSPPVLSPPRPGIPLRLYLTVTDTTAGEVLAQNVEGSERVIYNLSKKFI